MHSVAATLLSLLAAAHCNPVGGLTISGLDAEGTLWALVNTSVSLQAQVTSGENLQAVWQIGDNVTETQTYSAYDQTMSYNMTFERVETLPVTLDVSNDNNTVSTSFTLRVVHPINGISLSPSSVRSQTNEEIQLQLSYESDMNTDMGEVTLTVDWGDDSSDTPSNLTISPGGTDTVQKVFGTQGVHNISVTLATVADSKVMLVPAFIWNMSIDPSSQAGKPGDVFSIHLAEGFHYSIDCGEGDPPTSIESALYSDDVSCSYSSPNVYNTTLTAANGEYSKTEWKTIIVENPLSAENFDMNLDDRVIPLSDPLIHANVSYTSSTSTTGFCRWKFGSSLPATPEKLLSMPTDFPQFSNYSYSSSDNRSITFVCRNNISTSTAAIQVSVRIWDLHDFRVDINNPQIMHGMVPVQDVLLMLAVKDIQRMPSDVVARFTYGDGGPQEELAVTQSNFYHRYPLRKTYNGSVHLTYPGKESNTIYFQVQQGAFQNLGVNFREGQVETQPFVFTMQSPSAFSGTLTVDFGDGSDPWVKTVSGQAVSVHEVTHHYDTVSSFNASLTGTSTNTSRPYTEIVEFPQVQTKEMMHGLALAPGHSATLAVSPTTDKDVSLVWSEDVTGSVQVTAVAQGNVSVPVSVISAGRVAVVTVQGSRLSIGRQPLDVTMTVNGEQPTKLTLEILNQWAVGSLTVSGLDEDRKLWVLVNTSVNITASVTQGTDLTAQWHIGDTVIETQNYTAYTTDKTLVYSGTWTEVGDVSVRLVVSTQHNSVLTTFTLRVVHPINGISLDRPNVTAQANENVKLRLMYAAGMVTEMGDVTLNVSSWGGGSAGQSFGILTFVPGSSFNLSHVYDTQGIHSINVWLEAKPEKKFLTVPAFIWDKLDNVTLSIDPSSQTGKPGDVFTVYITNPPKEGFQYSIDCGEGTLHTNNESALYADYVAPDITCSYSSPNVYQVTLTASNGGYRRTTSETVIIEELFAVLDFAVDVDFNVIPVPDGLIHARVTAVRDKSNKGFCHWNFGTNTEVNTSVYLFMPADFPQSSSFTYVTPGDYMISYHCRNNISDMTAAIHVKGAGWTVQDFKVAVNNPQVMNDSVPVVDVLLNLTLLDIRRLPAGIKTDFMFGDGSPNRLIEMTDRETYHRYPLRGIYQGTAAISHPLQGSYVASFDVRQGSFQISVNQLQGIVDSPQEFVFVIEVPGPFSGTLTVDFGDGSAPWTKTVASNLNNNYTVSHGYTWVASFQATLTGQSTDENRRYTEQVNFDGPLVTDGAMSDMELELNPDTIDYPPGDTTATFRLARGQHRIRWVHCSVDFQEVLDPVLRTWNGMLAPGDAINISFEYITLGHRVVTLNCSSTFYDVPDYQVVEYPVRTLNPCFSDDPIFDRQYGLYNTPLQVLGSKPLTMVTRTVIYCPQSLPDFFWTLEEFDSATGLMTARRTDLKQPNADFLEFRPGALAPGLYRMSLNISFGADQNYTWLREMTFVQVMRTPLEAEITGGAFRRTGDTAELIDGYTLSFDPVVGVDDKAGLEFLWECQEFDTATLAELIEVTSQPGPLGGIVDCDQISTEFETGKRRLQVPSDVDNQGYLFTLRVQKEKTASVEENAYDISPPATVAVQFNAKSFSTRLECIHNCGRKVAVSSPMTVTTKCASCSATDMLDAEYEWTLYIFNNETNVYELLPDPQRYFLTSGKDSGQAIAVGPNRLKPCTRYRLLGHMSLERGEADAGMKFLTNCPPWGGLCKLDPTGGNVVKTRFNLSCSGWQDDGFADPTDNSSNIDVDGDGDPGAKSLYYFFMIRKNGIVVPLAQGGESNMPRMQLPLIPGQTGENYELLVRIYDALMDYAEVVLLVFLNQSSTGQSGTGDAARFEATINFWKGQAEYGERSSTIIKQLRGLTTASALLSTYPLSENRTAIEAASANITGIQGAVVNADWKTLWYDLHNPRAASSQKTELTQLTETFTNLVQKRKNDSESMNGQGIAALGEGMATILYNTEVNEEESVFAGGDVAESSTIALGKLCGTKPFPMDLNVTEAVFGIMALVGKVIDSSLPSYDLSLGPVLFFNSSDMGEDDSTFMISRFKVAQAFRDKHRINTTRTVMPRLERAVNTMLESLLSGVVLGQPNQEVRRGQMTLAAGKVSGRTLADTPFTAGSMRLQVDSVNQDGSESDPSASVDIRASVYEKNTLAWSSDGSSYEITSPVLKINITDSQGPKAVKKLTLSLTRGADTPIPAMDTYQTHDTRDGFDGWLYHRLTLRSAASAVVVQIALPQGLTNVSAYFRTGRPPTKARYDVHIEAGEIVTSNAQRRKRNSNPTGPGFGHTVKFFVGPGLLDPGIIFAGFVFPEVSADSNESLAYQLLSFSDACRVWDNNTQTWDSSACKVSAYSTPSETVCICENPPGMSFASSFFVAPNTIDFSTVFSKFDITNAAVYGTLIGLFAVWVLAVVWATRKDKQDKERWLVGYLKDNLVDDSYFYLLTVHTGMRKSAGTLSNVNFILTGNLGDTGVRILSDGVRTLETGSVMTYILATTQSLGDLNYVRVWHDNSGPDENGSWFLARLEAEDLQNGKRYNFLCEKWLALDKEDGLIDRIVPITLKTDVMTFDKLFSEHARVGITDAHLWFSCFLRPERSTFTRVQRVSCCLALLLLTMITSAMFYTPDIESGQSTNTIGMEVQIGILRFSMTTLWTSTVSIAITTIPLLIFVVLFRSCRPKWGPRAQAQKHRMEGIVMTMSSKKSLPRSKNGDKNKMEDNASDLLEDMLQQNPLPHGLVYAVWLLLLATMAACAFFLLLYSMQWGTTVSEQWLASFVLSFFESIFLMDPVKVLVLAVLLAYCASNPFARTKHQHIDMPRVHREAETFGTHGIDLMALPPDPVPEDVLEASRKRRKQEELAQTVFFELIMQIFFVFCIFSVSYGNRDQNTFFVNNHVENRFYNDGPTSFESIKNRTDVMKYMKETLLPAAFPVKDIAGNELNWKRRLFASDFTSFKVGPVRVRQVRMPERDKQPKVARKHPALRLNRGTYPPYDVDAEETGIFCLGWRRESCSEDELTTKLSLDAWNYTADVLDMPVWGTFAFYPSGGYLADFAINRDVVNSTMRELEENAWLDLQTRAVFVELSVYNPNVNLFTFIRMGTEFPEVGANVVWKDFKTIRIYNHLGAMGSFVLICEVIIALVVVALTVKTIKRLKNQRWAYFSDFWQVLDACTLWTAYVALVFYIIKVLAVKEVMNLWRTDPKVYVDFYLPVLWDEVYGYLLAALVFVVSLRMLRVLGYNKRVTMIAEVLARSGTPLFGFTVVFFVIITAYVGTGFIVFNSSMYEFRSLWDTFCTLYLVLLGKNVLGRFIEEASLVAQIYFISLTVFVILILYTMFQAIMCNATSLVRSDIINAPAPYGLTDVLAKFYRAAVADWVPQWVIKATTKAVAPTESSSAPGLTTTGKGATAQSSAPRSKNNNAHTIQVLATLSDHFNKLIDGEGQKKKRRKKKKCDQDEMDEIAALPL